jgi:F-type H+-transporting ATPase subunit epsilon
MPLRFELVTPERLVRSDEVHMVVVPGTEGDFGCSRATPPLCRRCASATC